MIKGKKKKEDNTCKHNNIEWFWLIQCKRSVQRKKSWVVWWLRAQESRDNVVVTHPSLKGFFERLYICPVTC